jgi:hypothetical protein
VSVDPSPNAADRADDPPGECIPELKREIDRLRTQLTDATAEAERYRRAAYARLTARVPYAPPSEDELRDLLHGPRGRPLLELIDELEREGRG